MTNTTTPQLRRELGLFGATLMGLGSILGTGAFVSIGIAAGVTGPSVVLATALAALVATCNALSSAQLAAVHPVSGGAYEYGYRLLTPAAGFTAGWMFLCAKTASAATAALGFAGYALHLAGLDQGGARIGLAVGAILVLTALTAGGIKRSNTANTLIVSITIGALLAFIVGVAAAGLRNGAGNLAPFFAGVNSDRDPGAAFLQATALMFVAFTGYGRIATMGEEVHDPRRTIPRAIVTTLFASAAIYILLALAAVAAAGAPAMSDAVEAAAAPLEVVASAHAWPGVAWLVGLGAVTAMLGVLLNLILGLSRVLLAMARRHDAPKLFTAIHAGSATPVAAVWMVGLGIAGLALLGSVKTTWSFSAFTVLVYYAINNLAALRLPKEDRLYSPLWAWGGLAACVFLAFWVEPAIWMAGLGLIAGGLIARALGQRVFGMGATQ